jgi:hypothetical protein
MPAQQLRQALRAAEGNMDEVDGGLAYDSIAGA